MGYNLNLIRNFLDKLDIIRKKYDEFETQKDQFNIFSALRENYDEVKLHSRFISSLLSWATKGNYLFLNEFIRVIESNFKYDKNSIEIYPSYENKSEYKDIDILLIDRATKHAIILENKIYATDSNHTEEGQLEKYYRIIIEEDNIPEDNIEVFYITLDGHEPTEESVATSNKYIDLKEKVQCISYKNQINDWLLECIKKVFDKPFQRETILQYLKLIKDMTNYSEKEEQIEILHLIGESESNLKSAKLLIDNLSFIHWHIIYNLWNNLADALSTHGYTTIHRIKEEDIGCVVNGSVRKKNQICLALDIKVNTDYIIRIEEYHDTFINYGIPRNQKISKKYIQVFKNLVNHTNSDYNNDDEFYIWKYPNLSSNEEFDSWDYKNDATFNLINNDFCNHIVKKIVDDINKFVNMINELALKQP